jgi:exonuclease SbcD
MRILASADFQIGAGATLGRTLTDHDELLSRIVDIAEREEADLFLLLGDAFQRRQTNRDEDEVFMRFLLAMARLCPILLLGGNHDWRGYERASTVGIFREMGVTVALEPGVHRYGDTAIASLPWAALGHLVAQRDGGERAFANQEAAAHLVTIARGLREQIEPGETAILAGHWAVTGASLPTGLPTDMLSEPVIEITDLEAQGWDSIALGHVHRAQTIGELGTAFYAGSPYACDWGEAEIAHGVWVLEPDPTTRSMNERALLVPSFVPIPDRPFWTLDLSELEEPPYEIAEALVMDAIVRVQIRASQEQARRLDLRALRQALYDAGAHFVAPIQLEIERPERARVEGLSEELDELAALDLWIEASGLNGSQADALRERTERYLGLVRA